MASNKKLVLTGDSKKNEALLKERVKEVKVIWEAVPRLRESLFFLQDNWPGDF